MEESWEAPVAREEDNLKLVCLWEEESSESEGSEVCPHLFVNDLSMSLNVIGVRLLQVDDYEVEELGENEQEFVNEQSEGWAPIEKESETFELVHLYDESEHVAAEVLPKVSKAKTR